MAVYERILKARAIQYEQALLCNKRKDLLKINSSNVGEKQTEVLCTWDE